MNNHSIEVFYDGECPLCSKEINWLKKRDPAGQALYSDLTSPGFLPPEGYSETDLMAEIHGRLADGSIIKGVEVFDHMYRAAGLGFLVRIGELPLIRPVLNIAYAGFAKLRLPLTGRKVLGKSCRVRT